MRSNNNMDGFVVRRRSPGSGVATRRSNDAKVPPRYLSAPSTPTKKDDAAPVFARKSSALSTTAPIAGRPSTSHSAARQRLDIDMNIDDGPQKPPRKKRGFRRPSKKTIKWALIVLLLLVLIGAGYFGYKLLIASGNIFKGGGDSSLLDKKPDLSRFQHEGDGRINVLLAATSEDDPNHPGGTLTDSVMIASIDPITKAATLISIPRDFWVEMPGCPDYSEQKINAAYQCGENMGFNEPGHPKGGIGYLQKIIEETFDLNINYYSKINYTAFRQAVDAVGGIDITIESEDPRGILDRNFDWICEYQCYKVKHANGPVHLDGEHALYLARSRNSAGGYGLPRGDFDRTENQRKMLIALQNKATSASTFSNPVKLSKLIDSIGNNLVTNFSRDELLKLYGVAKDIPADKIKSVGLADEENSILTTGSAGGASVVMPTAGLFEYGELRKFVRSQLIDSYIASEAPTIAIYNGSATPGLAAEQKDVLASYGYNVVIADNAPTNDYTANAFYDKTKGKKQVTKQYLQNRYDVQAKTGSLPEGINPLNPADGKPVDFVIILGAQ